MHSDAFPAALREALGASVRGEADALRVRVTSVAQVSELFRLAASAGVRVAVPGSEFAPGTGIVELDLDGLDRVRGLDVESRTVHVEGGTLLGAVEDRLRAAGLTLGTTDAAVVRESVGAWLARGAPGARAHGDDPVDQLVCGLEVVLADGTALAIRPAPRRAVGPDLVPSFVGGRGCLGVIVGAHLVVREVVPRLEVAYRFATREAAESARAWVRGRGVRPASTSLTSGPGELCYLRVRVEGRSAVREASLATVARVARERGGEACDPDCTPDAPPPSSTAPSELVRALARALVRVEFSARSNPLGRTAMSCLFCKLVDGTIPAKIVLEEPDVLAFHDAHPVSPTHVLVIPKRHLGSLADATAADSALLGRLLTVAREVAVKLELRDGYRTVINTGEHGGQSVHHLHVHVLGGRHHGWPPG